MEAQNDPAKFFDLVIRHENTKKKLKIAPHQEVLFSFVKAHPQVVLRQPILSSKTFCMMGMALWLTGNDVTQRGVIVSHARDQAEKALRMITAYFDDEELYQLLKFVFPHLEPSKRTADKWSQSEITVHRPETIRDPTIRAVGIGTKIHGSRLSWCLCDDMIDDSNSYSPTERERLKRAFNDRVLARMDFDNSRVIVTNTPWDREDLSFHLEEKMGWATLTMDVDGFIRFTNAKAPWIQYALDHYLRPSNERAGGQFDWYRLRAHDPDPDETVQLWPEMHKREKIEEYRATWSPHTFARLMMCAPFDEDAAHCKRDWIERCKRQGIGTSLVSSYDGDNQTFTGIDLAVGKKKTHDRTVFYTIEFVPPRGRRILDIESGRWSGPEIIDKIIEKTDAYKSSAAVETNAAQKFIMDFAIERKKNLKVTAHSTQLANKRSIEFGVESIFNEIRNEEWIIPCNSEGVCNKEVQEFINECLYYHPEAHTGDRLAAAWIAREAARKGGRSSGTQGAGCGERRAGTKMGAF